MTSNSKDFSHTTSMSFWSNMAFYKFSVDSVMAYEVWCRQVGLQRLQRSSGSSRTKKKSIIWAI